MNGWILFAYLVFQFSTGIVQLGCQLSQLVQVCVTYKSCFASLKIGNIEFEVRIVVAFLNYLDKLGLMRFSQSHRNRMSQNLLTNL